MPRFIKKTSKKAGLPPGTLVHVGERKQDVIIERRGIHARYDEQIESMYA